jgi:uncharacterized membrane protein YfcA
MTTDPLILGYIALALAVSGFAKGVSGTGLPLIAVPLMTVAVDLQVAVALITLSLVGTNIVQAVTSSEVPFAIRRYWALMAMIPIGTFAGTYLLASADPAVLERATGAIVIAFVAYMLLGFRMTLSRTALVWAAPTAGLAAGLIGGVTAIFAPPLLMLLLWAGEPKERFVATLAVSYIVASIALGASLASFDLMTAELFLWSAAAFLPVLLGQVLGTRARRFVSETLFRRAIQAVLFAAGLKMLLS